LPLKTHRLGMDRPGHKADERPQKARSMTKKTISARALIQRINRKLRPDGERLRVLRGVRWWNDLGDYYVTNESNCIVAQHVDLEKFGRACQALSHDERLATGER